MASSVLSDEALFSIAEQAIEHEQQDELIEVATMLLEVVSPELQVLLHEFILERQAKD